MGVPPSPVRVAVAQVMLRWRGVALSRFVSAWVGCRWGLIYLARWVGAASGTGVKPRQQAHGHAALMAGAKVLGYWGNMGTSRPSVTKMQFIIHSMEMITSLICH
jgi:hypothetical protein